MAYWCTKDPGEDGRHYMAVNFRLTEPVAITTIPIQRFDGLEKFASLPRDGKCIADVWF